MNIKRDIRFRVYVAFTCIMLLGIAILVKAALIQVKEGPELRALALQMNTRNDTLEANRGNIYSEDGTLLCSTIPQFDVHVDFTVINPDSFYKHVEELAQRSASLLGKYDAADWKAEYVQAFKNGVRYYPLAKKLKYYEYQELRSFPLFNKGQRRGGIIADVQHKRVNPYGKLAYRAIGLWRPGIWIDKKLVKNVVGLEATYDTVLSGTNGYCVRQRNAGNKWTTLDGSLVEPEDGRDIVTTIDMNIQDVAEHSLQAILEQYQCKYGTVVVMEVATGKIRAMVNLGRQESGDYWEDFNYAMIPTEPGSTFKLATLTSLLQDNLINVADNVNCEGGAKRFGNRIMHDSHHGLGSMPIRDAFAHSSNVGMASLAYQHYYKDPSQFTKHLEALHLDVRTGIDLEGERRPRVMKPKDKDWSATTLPWMATGYGVLITPLHTCMLYNAVANNGKMMKPYMVSRVSKYGKTIEEFKPTVLTTLGDEEMVAQLRSCAEEVVLTGTGKHIKSPFYTIAGKTGTAQVADKGIRYTDGVYQGSFVGYFPADKPKYSMVVVIRTKARSGAYYGGTIAAPVFRMIADKIFALSSGTWDGPIDSFAKSPDKKFVAKPALASNYTTALLGLGAGATITTGTTADVVARIYADSNGRVGINTTPLKSRVLPNLTGMGLRDALFLLEKMGLAVTISGSGTVYNQSIPAGTMVRKGQSIILTLS